MVRIPAVACLATLSTLTLLGVPASAQVLETGIQDNGLDCVTEWTNASASIQRTSTGLQCLESVDSNITVHCPITEPSDDSYPSSAKIRGLEVFYQLVGGNDPPSLCAIVSRDASGGLLYSPSLVQGTSSTTGGPVMKLSSPFQLSSSTTLSVGVQCQLAGGTVLMGSFARMEHHRIEGGI